MRYNRLFDNRTFSAASQDRFFQEASLIVRLDENRIEKTFLLEVERRVSKDNIVVIENQEYEVDYRYSGKKLLLRYSPDLKRIYSVDRKTGEMEEVHLLNKVSNSTCHRHSFMFSNAGGAD